MANKHDTLQYHLEITESDGVASSIPAAVKATHPGAPLRKPAGPQPSAWYDLINRCARQFCLVMNADEIAGADIHLFDTTAMWAGPSVAVSVAERNEGIFCPTSASTRVHVGDFVEISRLWSKFRTENVPVILVLSVCVFFFALFLLAMPHAMLTQVIRKYKYTS